MGGKNVMERLKNRETEIRNQYVKEIKKVLLGPGTEDISSDPEYEVISENPKARYTTGILYSINDDSKNKMNKFNELVLADESLEEVSESDGENKEDNFIIDNNYFPSTMGVTFYCETNENFKVDYKIETATYNKTKKPFISLSEVQVQQINEYIQQSEENEKNFFTIIDIDTKNKTVRYKDDNEDNKKVLQGIIDNLNIEYYSELESLFYRLRKTNYYERKPFIYESYIDFDYGIEKYDTKIVEIDEDNKFELFIKVVPIKISSNKIIHTITLVIKNLSSKDPMFQTKITLESNEPFNFSASEDIRGPNLESFTYEEARSIFLYRNKKTYGVGHGVSVVWNEEKNRIRKLETDYIPEYETIPMSFAIDNLNEDILNPESYLINVEKNQQIEKLELFVKEYGKWIDNLEQRATSFDKIYKKYTEENIRKCREAYLRMKKAVVFLEENNDAFKCFNYANEAILLQRYSNNQDKIKRFNDKDYSGLEGSLKWRPFQLAFILHSLESVLNEESEERELLDLMYVTTGGGKTEAYLFLIAVVILYRRMKEEDSVGVSVIMRYTLRLLTSQQFERATQLICVLEFIRKVESSTFGETEISIGLWIGEGTENRIANAKEVLADMADSYNLNQALEKNRFQVLKCPWCNEEHSIIPKDDKKSFTSKRNWGYCAIDSRSNNYNMKCMNKDCFFSKGLPIYVIDESIIK